MVDKCGIIRILFMLAFESSSAAGQESLESVDAGIMLDAFAFRCLDVLVRVVMAWLMMTPRETNRITSRRQKTKVQAV